MSSSGRSRPSNVASRETLVRDVASLYNTYVGKGVRINTFVKKANPTLNIDGLDELLDLYFILTDERIQTPQGESLPGVLSFIDNLPDQIRRLKTAMGRDVVISEDEIRGPIDWGETMNARARRLGSRGRVFAYDEPEKQFNLPENRVLKRLLTVIDELVRTQLEDRIDEPQKYVWADPWLSSDQRRRILRDTLYENPYLDRVPRCDEPLPYQELKKVHSSRSSLYRDAAALLLLYRRLKRYDIYPEDAKNLLRQYFLIPGPESSSIGSEGTEVLFEFYWAFKLLDSVGSPQLELIKKSHRSGSVASWTDENSLYTLYHDQSNTKEIKFEDSPSNTRVPPLQRDESDFFTQRRRYVRVMERFYQAFGEGPYRRFPDKWNRRRRPDIVVVKRDQDTNKINHLYVGEVKHSRNETTITDGVEQLLETVSIANSSEGHLAGTGELLDDKRITAALFVLESPLEKGVYPEGLEIYEYGEDPTLTV